jgi:hypothetical protein
MGRLMSRGVPVGDLTDAELEAQGTAAHATRNWVFLHGTADQFRHHTERMLELEQEYLRRFPKRTWQGSGDSPDAAATPQPPSPEQVRQLLGRVADAGGRIHKLELHQVAREVGLSPASLAALYRGSDPVLATERDERVLTDTGRRALA